MGKFEGVDNSVKKELKPGSRTCQCGSCDEFFTGVQPSDRHLVSNERNPNIPPRCLRPAEMRALGMIQNVHGVWQTGTWGKKRKEEVA